MLQEENLKIKEPDTEERLTLNVSLQNNGDLEGRAQFGRITRSTRCDFTEDEKFQESIDTILETARKQTL